MKDILPDTRSCGGRQRHHGYSRKALSQQTKLLIIRSKVMAPLNSSTHTRTRTHTHTHTFTYTFLHSYIQPFCILLCNSMMNLLSKTTLFIHLFPNLTDTMCFINDKSSQQASTIEILQCTHQLATGTYL
jgi:hypothetical protein